MKHRNSFFSRAAALALALIMAFSFAGCSEEDKELVNAVIDVADAVISESANEEAGKAENNGEQAEEVPDDSQPSGEDVSPDEQAPVEDEEPLIDIDGIYTSMEDVSLYLWTYGRLPSNFITKNEARKLGWEGGGLDRYAEDKCIGGDRFGNREGLLPEEYDYIECDIDTLNRDSRGAKRIVFSEGCELIYYTDDHYESFTLIYGEE